MKEYCLFEHRSDGVWEYVSHSSRWSREDVESLMRLKKMVYNRTPPRPPYTGEFKIYSRDVPDWMPDEESEAAE